MNAKIKLDRSVKTSPATSGVEVDVSRRDGTIRGIILSAKEVNLDHVFGMAKENADAPF